MIAAGFIVKSDTYVLNSIALKLFNKAVVDTDAAKLEFRFVSNYTVKLGYLVHPDLCTADILDWVKSQQRDYNCTFYKKWSDVINKSRFELYIDQLLHYASTYGTNFTGEVYLPEGKAEVPDFKQFNVIAPITKEEVISRCEGLLFSGIALKQETIDDVLSVFEILGHVISAGDINNVKNREAKMYLHKKTGTLPFDAVEMVRYLVYLATDKTLLIKDNETIEAIKGKGLGITTIVEKFGTTKLSSVFLRFKPIFLAFKSGNRDNATCVNELRKLAVKNHKPMQVGYFEKLLSSPELATSLPKMLGTITNFKKITLLQTILVRLKELDNRAFVIRNQKLFIKEGNEVSYDLQFLKSIYSVLYWDLVDCLKKKKCSVKLPKGVNLTLPVSEKSFIGNYPLGTSFDFSDSDNIVGINWRGADGANDLDLKLIDIDGTQYGWNAAYTNDDNSIVFSGDMTSANPEATELYYTAKGFKPAIVKVNLYSGEPKSKFKFFLAKEKLQMKKDRFYGSSVNYMVNPKNIVINVDCEMASSEQTLGVITENKFVLAQFRTGKGRVAGDSVTNQYTEYVLNTLDCYLSLEKLLRDAGFTFTAENPDLDLSEVSKDSLINLLKN